MDEFNKMLQDIIKRGRDRLSFHAIPSSRVIVINELKDELVAMKELYEAINGPIKPNEASFEQIIKQLS